MSLLHLPLGAALAAAYAAFPSLALGVVAVTIALHVATFPLTRRAHASQRQLAALGPELAARQGRHQRDHAGVSPFGALVSPIVQGLAFFGLFGVLRDLARGATGATVAGSALATAVRRGQALRCWGVDLGQTGLVALGASPAAAMVALGLVVVIVGAGVWQSRRAAAAPADTDADATRLARRLQLVLPVVSVGAALTLPLLVTVLSATAAVCRLVQHLALQRLGA